MQVLNFYSTVFADQMKRGPQDGHDPARRQAPQVPQEPGRARHRRLPVLTAREAVPRRDRQRRGQARQGALAARHRARQPRVPPHRGARPLPASRSTGARSRSRTRSPSCASRRSSRTRPTCRTACAASAALRTRAAAGRTVLLGRVLGCRRRRVALRRRLAPARRRRGDRQRARDAARAAAPSAISSPWRGSLSALRAGLVDQLDERPRRTSPSATSARAAARCALQRPGTIVSSEQQRRRRGQPGDQLCPPSAARPSRVPPCVSVNARPMPSKQVLHLRVRSARGDGPYQGRPRAAITPKAAAIAKRMLLRKPIVRICGAMIGTNRHAG